METTPKNEVGTGTNRGHPPFEKGNKHAVGRAEPSIKALTRQFLKAYLNETLAKDLLDAQSVRALDGDTVAFKAVFDYCGQKPVEQTEQVSTVFTPEEIAKLREHGWKDDE